MSCCRAVTEFHELDEILFSYDIACQWRINLPSCMKKLKCQMQLPPHMLLFTVSLNVIVWVTSWKLSMNVQLGSGQTDGEGVERTWSKTNSCASCTKVMGPSHCHHTLDDLLGSHNWLKCCGHGE